MDTFTTVAEISREIAKLEHNCAGGGGCPMELKADACLFCSLRMKAQKLDNTRAMMEGEWSKDYKSNYRGNYALA